MKGGKNMITKDILNVVPTLHSAQLINNLYPKKKKKKDLLKSGTRALIGIPMIQVESQLIGNL